jgi:uncharacterized protein YlxP (DUF503 family)
LSRTLAIRRAATTRDLWVSILIMFVGVVRADLFIPHSHSLKERRSVVTSLRERLKKLNASVAEVGETELWQRATLGLAFVSDSADYLEGIVREARSLIESEYRAQIIAWDWDVSPAVFED